MTSRSAPTHDEPIVAPSTSGSFEEPRHLEQRRPQGGGWRELDAPHTLRCFIGAIWVDADAIDVNDASREVRVQWPPGSGHHEVLDASHYQAAAGLFG